MGMEEESTSIAALWPEPRNLCVQYPAQSFLWKKKIYIYILIPVSFKKLSRKGDWLRLTNGGGGGRNRGWKRAINFLAAVEMTRAVVKYGRGQVAGATTRRRSAILVSRYSERIFLSFLSFSFPLDFLNDRGNGDRSKRTWYVYIYIYIYGNLIFDRWTNWSMFEKN